MEWLICFSIVTLMLGYLLFKKINAVFDDLIADILNNKKY